MLGLTTRIGMFFAGILLLIVGMYFASYAVVAGIFGGLSLIFLGLISVSGFSFLSGLFLYRRSRIG